MTVYLVHVFYRQELPVTLSPIMEGTITNARKNIATTVVALKWKQGACVCLCLSVCLSVCVHLLVRACGSVVVQG